MKTIHIHAQFDALECSVQCRSALSSFFCITYSVQETSLVQHFVLHSNRSQKGLGIVSKK